jgi:hypothetical protein
MRIALAATIGLFILATLTTAASSLPVASISIDTAKGRAGFRVEIAGDPASREKGLMFRKSMARNAGMLFDFHQTVMTSFWMKNTILPLDIVFIRSDGTVSSIAADAVPYSMASIPSSEPISAVLEISAGSASALGIAPGDVVHAAIFHNAR